MPTVEFARVLAGAKSFKDQGIANLSDTYRGQILIGKNEVRTAIIKDIPLREVANEVLAATLAIAISLPVPPPFIALASPSDLPTKHASKLGGSSLLFASADVNSPSVAQVVVAQAGAAQVAAICFGNTTHAPSRGEVERIVSNLMASCPSAVRSCGPAARA